jgi:hypothetical protein
MHIMDKRGLLTAYRDIKAYLLHSRQKRQTATTLYTISIEYWGEV